MVNCFLSRHFLYFHMDVRLQAEIVSYERWGRHDTTYQPRKASVLLTLAPCRVSMPFISSAACENSGTKLKERR